MKYLIVADIKGVKYYVRIKDEKYAAPIIEATYEGLKRNATIFDEKALADAFKEAIESPWELSVEPA